MTTASILLLILGALLITLLAVLWRIARSESTGLRERLGNATRELERLQLSFTRFAPHEVIERIISDGISTAGEKKEVTVLFADLVGFTALSETVDPSTLVRILNGYFARMSDVIIDNRGHISSFIGDGILVFYGTLEPNPWQSNDALYTALAMREQLDQYNEELAAEGLPPLGLGVGIHRGMGVAGLVGSPERMEFAFVGRTVNLASRVQDLTRDFEVDILVTDEVREALDPRFQLTPLPPTKVKGIAKPVAIYSVDVPGNSLQS